MSSILLYWWQTNQQGQEHKLEILSYRLSALWLPHITLIYHMVTRSETHCLWMKWIRYHATWSLPCFGYPFFRPIPVSASFPVPGSRAPPVRFLTLMPLWWSATRSWPTHDCFAMLKLLFSRVVKTLITRYYNSCLRLSAICNTFLLLVSMIPSTMHS